MSSCLCISVSLFFCFLIAKLIFNFNFKLEDEIALLLISPTTHQISSGTTQISSGTANPTEKVYWQCSTTTFPIEIEWMDLYCNFWI